MVATRRIWLVVVFAAFVAAVLCGANAGQDVALNSVFLEGVSSGVRGVLKKLEDVRIAYELEFVKEEVKYMCKHIDELGQKSGDSEYIMEIFRKNPFLQDLGFLVSSVLEGMIESEKIPYLERDGKEIDIIKELEEYADILSEYGIAFRNGLHGSISEMMFSVRGESSIVEKQISLVEILENIYNRLAYLDKGVRAWFDERMKSVLLEFETATQIFGHRSEMFDLIKREFGEIEKVRGEIMRLIEKKEIVNRGGVYDEVFNNILSKFVDVQTLLISIMNESDDKFMWTRRNTFAELQRHYNMRFLIRGLIGSDKKVNEMLKELNKMRNKISDELNKLKEIFKKLTEMFNSKNNTLISLIRVRTQLEEAYKANGEEYEKKHEEVFSELKQIDEARNNIYIRGYGLGAVQINRCKK